MTFTQCVWLKINKEYSPIHDPAVSCFRVRKDHSWWRTWLCIIKEGSGITAVVPAMVSGSFYCREENEMFVSSLQSAFLLSFGLGIRGQRVSGIFKGE